MRTSLERFVKRAGSQIESFMVSVRENLSDVLYVGFGALSFGIATGIVLNAAVPSQHRIDALESAIAELRSTRVAERLMLLEFEVAALLKMGWLIIGALLASAAKGLSDGYKMRKTLYEIRKHMGQE